MQKKENFNVSEVENDINSRNKIYLETNVINIIPGKPGPTGEKGNDGDDGTEGLGGEDGLIGNSGNDGDDAAKVKFINPDGSDAGFVSVINPNTEDVHEIKIPRGKKGDRGDTRKLNFCYVYKDQNDIYNKSDSNCYLENPSEEADISKDMYLYIPKGKKGERGDQGDCSMESPGFPGPTGDTGPDGDKGEKGPRGLEGKRGIDADTLNFGNNITGVEYKICFDETPDNCIDVPKLKAINQDYQDKIDNKPYEDILSKTNNKYVPVLLRRINRLKNDLCLAHLTGDYSNGYITDIKKDLDETYKLFNRQEGIIFKKLYNNVDDLNEYCTRFFNIVAVDFVFDKTKQIDCTEVDLYTFIETHLKSEGKWDDRFNTYKNTPVINIIIDDKTTDIISNSIDKAALTINVDKFFEIFPNIYEITLDVQRYITGKHGQSGGTTDIWTNKTSTNLNGGSGQPGNDGGPAIEIIYNGTDVLKEIVIKINEKGDPGTKITGGFGSSGGLGGMASRSFYKKRASTERNKPKETIPEKDEMQGDALHFSASGPGEGGVLESGQQAWVSGSRDKNGTTYNYSMIAFGKYHLASSANQYSEIHSNKNQDGYYWKFKKGAHEKRDDFKCNIYKAGANYFPEHRPLIFSGFTFPINDKITPKRRWCVEYKAGCGAVNQGGGCDCKKHDEVEYICAGEWSKPKDKANWHDFTAEKWKITPSYEVWGACEDGWRAIPNTNRCCEIVDDDECFIRDYWNVDGKDEKGKDGSPTIGVDEGMEDSQEPRIYNASKKNEWNIIKENRKKIVPGYTTQPSGYDNEHQKGEGGAKAADGKDGKVISANENIYDISKVIIFLNQKLYEY